MGYTYETLNFQGFGDITSKEIIDRVEKVINDDIDFVLGNRVPSSTDHVVRLLVSSLFHSLEEEGYLQSETEEIILTKSSITSFSKKLFERKLINDLQLFNTF